LVTAADFRTLVLVAARELQQIAIERICSRTAGQREQKKGKR